MSIKKVIFSVGVAHPLYNKEVDAEIISENTGYNEKCVYARTVKPVYYPKNDKGLLVYNNGKFVGYKPREAYEEIHEGYCKLVHKTDEYIKILHDVFGNTATIKKVKTIPYKGASGKVDSYVLSLTSDYDNDFMYHLSVYETEKDAINELMTFSCGTWK